MTTALIAASAAIFGGLLSAFATRSVERMRLQHAVLPSMGGRLYLAAPLGARLSSRLPIT
jgi:hypothetical protein